MVGKQINVGILAHVDAGKTTLAEALLFESGAIRRAGRVDHGDAFLDNFDLEKNRGITIFSKQAALSMADRQVTLLDTPGHVDFSAEMERTLQVLDYALLVISAADGVQGHVLTLWRLLRRYEIPTFIFINKMDQSGVDADRVMAQLKDRLGEGCVSFDGVGITQQEEISGGSDAFWDEVTVLDEYLLERYLEGHLPQRRQLSRLVSSRQLFPCMMGSALRMQGVSALMEMMGALMEYPEYPASFGARVFKISRSGKDRLTWLKVTGGSLLARQEIGGEKVNQIRLYAGQSAQMIQEAQAGQVVAVTGLTGTFAGQGLGAEKDVTVPLLSPVLSYTLVLPEGTDVHQAYLTLKTLEEEIPEMHLGWDPHLGEIHVQVMGDVQIEILTSLIAERYQMAVSFDEGEVVYRETITDICEGVGHFEPLRHYAEVHLLMQPGKSGSGIRLATACPRDTLEVNWQNLVLTHLQEKEYRGTLTGAPLTDMEITLVSGRAHLKHTEGGDFREATYRAVRQGLMTARAEGKCRLLEPCYDFTLEIPERCLGRAINDIQTMHGTFDGPEQGDGVCRLTGRAPVATMRLYAREVAAYSSGEGRLTLRSGGYVPCHNEEEVLERRGYDPESDTDDPSGSVFCSHGAGVYVPWNEVPQHMHLPSALAEAASEDAGMDSMLHAARTRDASVRSWESMVAGEEELKAIFERTYGAIRQDREGWNRASRVYKAPGSSETTRRYKGQKGKAPCMLVDGYNIIFDWKELKELAGVNMDSARTRLMEILSNYQGYRNMTLILVFDAYKVEGGEGEDFKYHNIYIVYTKEAETADTYIERAVHEMADKYQITVATSDGAEQAIISGKGAIRMSARELHEDIQNVCREIETVYLKENPTGKHYLFDVLGRDMLQLLEEVRLGHRQI